MWHLGMGRGRKKSRLVKTSRRLFLDALEARNLMAADLAVDQVELEPVDPDFQPADVKVLNEADFNVASADDAVLMAFAVAEDGAPIAEDGTVTEEGDGSVGDGNVVYDEDGNVIVPMRFSMFSLATATDDGTVAEDGAIAEEGDVKVATDEEVVAEDGTIIHPIYYMFRGAVNDGEEGDAAEVKAADEEVPVLDGEVSPIYYSMAGGLEDGEVTDGTVENPEIMYMTGGDLCLSAAPVADVAIWHNIETPEDINGDGTVSPLDALSMITWINNNGIGELGQLEIATASLAEAEASSTEFFPDVDNDGIVAPLDILILINHLNAEAAGMEPVAFVVVNAESLELPVDGCSETTDNSSGDTSLADEGIFGIAIGEPDPNGDAAMDDTELSGDAVDAVMSRMAIRPIDWTEETEEPVNDDSAITEKKIAEENDVPVEKEEVVPEDGEVVEVKAY